MACHLSIWDTENKTRQEVAFDEDNTTRVIEDEHAGVADGLYADADGNNFKADWTKLRLVAFRRDN